MRCLALTLLALLLAFPAAADDIVAVGVGANGAWYNAQEFASPDDFELGGNARASLSPHISAVASMRYALGEKYVHSSVGGRYTATDVDNKNFSIGIGIQYHFSSKPELRPEEWAPDVTIGYVPFPDQSASGGGKGFPALIAWASSNYGLTSKQAALMAGLTLAVWKGGRQ